MELDHVIQWVMSYQLLIYTRFMQPDGITYTLWDSSFSCLHVFTRCQVPMLLTQYEERRFCYQHFPMGEDNMPSVLQCLQIVVNIHQALLARKKLLVQ